MWELKIKGVMKRFTLILGIILLGTAALKAQQVPVYSQYMENKYLINPAHAGSQGYTNYNLTARQQWLGFENATAPVTQAIAAETRVLQSSFISKMRNIRSGTRRRRPSGRVGLGGYIFNDKSGMINRTGIQATYAYHLPLNESQLSFGISGTVYQFKLDRDGLILNDETDPLIDGRENTLFVPDASAGVYYMHGRFYAGLSTLNLFESVLKFGSDQSYSNYKLERYHYFMSGYRYDLGDGFEIEPSVLLKSSERVNLQADINVKAYYQRDYWLGLSYRTGNAIISMVGVSIGKLYFGYAYDYSFKDVQNLTYGSHEILIGVKIGDSRRRYRWLRRF